MRSHSLMNELFAAVESGDADERIGLFKRLGISGRAVVATGAFLATQHIRPLSGPDGLYEPDEGGIEGIVVPVYDSLYDNHLLVDLAAFIPEAPERWWLRVGNGVLLGADVVDKAEFFDEPVHLYPSPLAWLQNECRGACALDWPRAALHLGDIKQIVTDYETACRLDEALARPSPEILVQEREAA